MRIFVLTKKHLTILCAVLLTVTVTAIFAVGVFAKTQRKVPIYCVENSSKQIALSFDAAWGNDDTQQLIDILSKYNAKATFFVVAQWVEKYPESVKQLADAGHQIQNHSATHPHMPQLSKEKMIEELNVCNEKIEAVTGVKPTLFRAPYGDYSNAMLEAVESVGMYTIQWDVDSRDWQESASVDSIVKGVVDKVTDGSIVLFHNDAEHTPEALPLILDQLVAKGYTFVFINDLIYKENYTIDHAGKQIPNKAAQ